MKKYNCTYNNAHKFGVVLENISASSPRDAYQKYIEKVGEHEAVVYVETGLLSTETFDDHIDRIKKLEKEEKLRQEKESSIQTANELLSYLSSRKNDGYFKLSKIDKINIQCYFLYLSNTVEKRELSDGEIEFIKAWVHFKDRELGQSLIAQTEAKKPAAERGKSELAKTITMGIVAGNIAKGHQLRELKELNESVDKIAEDVEDASGGFEM